MRACARRMAMRFDVRGADDPNRRLDRVDDMRECAAGRRLFLDPWLDCRQRGGSDGECDGA